MRGARAGRYNQIMTRSATYDLLSRGRAAAKAGEKAEARRNLERLLNLAPPEDERLEAYYWLSEVSDDPREQRSYLEDILASNLGDARARRKLAILDGKLRPNEMVDPDAIPAPAPGSPQAAHTQAFTCPKCGGRMSFAPDGQSLTCEYCETREHVASGGAGLEEDFLVAMVTAKAHSRPVVMHAVTCSGCAASFILPAEAIAQTCPYCQTPYAIDQVEQRTLDAPDSILPFKVDAAQAREALRAWLANDPPESPVKASRPAGLYLPVWLFNMGGQVDWSGYVYKEKRRVPVSGARVISLPNLLVAAARRLPECLLPVLNGYDLDALQQYDARYLADFPAESFQLSAADASLEARRQAMQQVTREVQLTEIDQAVLDFRMRTNNMLVEGYRLALVPLWLMFYEVEQRRYNVAVNGQTGAVTGERPEKGLLGWVSRLL